jgi:hypothetical protein
MDRETSALVEAVRDGRITDQAQCTAILANAVAELSAKAKRMSQLVREATL